MGTGVGNPFFNIDQVISISCICDIVEITIDIKYQTLYLTLRLNVDKMDLDATKMVDLVTCQQQKHIPACASAQSAQRLDCSLSGIV